MMTVRAGRQVYRIQAEILKALANPVRLEILHLLGSREVSSKKLMLALGISKTNLSQHLAVLRKAHIVTDRREGVSTRYRLAYPEIEEACRSVGEALAGYLLDVGKQAKVLLREAGRG
jgi:DNA-binding transcriptional ArsR family regulator